MAGGAGERFWPLSRRTYPKQLIKVADNKSMLGAVVERILPLISADDVFVVTSAVLKLPIEVELPMLPPQNVIAEPSARNTSACLALACAVARQRYSDDVTMLVLTADSYINDGEAFLADCRLGFEVAEENASLVLFGVRPNRPETGYGYIEATEPVSLRGANIASTMRVAAFREKPNLETAFDYLRSGQHYWNSGQFVWKVSALEDAFNGVFAECGRQIQPMTTALKADDTAALSVAFEQIPKLSIDYGVLEKYGNVAMIAARFPWDDIGTWDSIGRLLENDEHENVVLGNGMVVDGSGCILYSVCGEQRVANDKKLIVAYNVKDLVIVNTDDAILVFPKEHAQGVKAAVSAIRDRGLHEYL